MGASINCTEAALVHVAVHHVIGVCNVGVLDRSWLGVWVLLLVLNDHLWDWPDVARAVVPVTVLRVIRPICKDGGHCRAVVWKARVRAIFIFAQGPFVVYVVVM